MKRLFHAMLVVALSGAVTLSTAQSADDADRTPVSDYSVYVDPPTGYVFVKLPQGWKFVGHVDRTSIAELPPGVLTNLLGTQTSAQSQQAGAALAMSGAR